MTLLLDVRVSIPVLVFPEMRLRAAGLVPPIWLLELLMRKMPLTLPCPSVPAASVPIKLPAITWPPEVSGWMPAPLKRLITSPRTVDKPALAPSLRPVVTDEEPFSSMSRTASLPLVCVFALAPGCV